MAEKIVFENHWATVVYETDDHYIYHTIHEPVSGQPLHDVLNAGLDALQVHGAIKWLSDDRQNAALTPEDVEFSLSDWGPRAAQAGWKYWALVVPQEMAGRASMRDVIEAFHNLGVRVMVFTDLDAAHQWLVSM